MPIVRMKGYGRGSWYQLVLTLVILSMCVTGEKQKRQIFREQVVPELGGKIPEEAFRTDRLALNRLNKEGISIPDGVVLEARHVHKHPHQGIPRMPDVIKVYLTPDGRYVPPEGRFHYNHPKAVDTTYIIRKPFIRGGHYKSSNNLAAYKARGYIKPPATYYRRIVPIAPPAKPGVYKPIIAPLVLPSRQRELDNSYLPAWDIAWDTVYEPFEDYFANNIAVFNSHQIITDYEGFLNDFHGRSLRHAGTRNGDRNQHQPSAENRKFDVRPTTLPEPQRAYQKNIPNVVPHSAGYTNLTKIPETSFSCRGRKGMYADLETKCQVFHDCSGWSRTSSLCPSGTAFSEVKKRCEWWNTVQCRL